MKATKNIPHLPHLTYEKLVTNLLDVKHMIEKGDTSPISFKIAQKINLLIQDIHKHYA